jgi:hypothetical protein
MHTVEILSEALRLAQRMGYRMREESLGGVGGGGCEIRGKKWIFLDLDLSPSEQLDQVLDTLRHERDTFLLPMPSALRAVLERKAA